MELLGAFGAVVLDLGGYYLLRCLDCGAFRLLVSGTRAWIPKVLATTRTGYWTLKFLTVDDRNPASLYISKCTRLPGILVVHIGIFIANSIKPSMKVH